MTVIEELFIVIYSVTRNYLFPILSNINQKYQSEIYNTKGPNYLLIFPIILLDILTAKIILTLI